MASGSSLRLSLYLASRVGRAPPPEPARPDRPDGPLVWMQCGSGAGTEAALELAERIRRERDDIHFLFTCDSDIVRNAAPTQIAGTFVAATPDDSVAAARAFLAHWRPDVAVWTEKDMRPALIHEAHTSGIPLLLLEADPSARDTFQNWSRRLVQDVLAMFGKIIAGDDASATEFRRWGALPTQIETVGILQQGPPVPRCNEAERADLTAQIGGRPTWLAASVTDAELNAVIYAHQTALRRAHRLLLILVPYDLATAATWKDQLVAADMQVGQRSDGDDILPDMQIYLADTAGEMGLWYRLAAIAFLGRSLDGTGGINPLDAAALGSAIVHGPSVGRYQRAYDRLRNAGAARHVRSQQALGETIEALLSPARAAEMARKGWDVSSAGADVTDRAIDVILSEIETL